MGWISFFLSGTFAMALHTRAPIENLCKARELARKDCRLMLTPYDVQISKVKITWNDSKWTAIADAPMPTDDAQWEKVALTPMKKRWLIQFWIWDGGKGAPKVQSLHWIVGEIVKQTFVVRADQILRKREVRPTTPVRYMYDKMISHKLKATGDTIQWTAGRQSGSF